MKLDMNIIGAWCSSNIANFCSVANMSLNISFVIIVDRDSSSFRATSRNVTGFSSLMAST